jgi:hypothetical protein
MTENKAHKKTRQDWTVKNMVSLLSLHPHIIVQPEISIEAYTECQGKLIPYVITCSTIRLDVEQVLHFFV